MARKPRKIRTEFRKNRESRRRKRGLAAEYQHDEALWDREQRTERISGKGELSRHRTVRTTEDGLQDPVFALDVRLEECRPGRVLSVRGLLSTVEDEHGQQFRCATRRLLKSLAIDQRHVVVAGDRVMFRPANAEEGIIERIEPRYGILSRTSRGKQQILVSNVDQVLIVTSAAEPVLKPHLIDRMLCALEQAHLQPVLCVNKIDLVDLASLQPLLGVYGQMGYPTLAVSAVTGLGIELLRSWLRGKHSAVTGQSGVGKSSLLNAVQPGLNLRVGEISLENQKGRHTTTTAELISLKDGGWIVDTPGIRQFQLWDVIPQEVAGLFRDLRPYVSQCRFPDCTHTHEEYCAVKDAVADQRVDLRRYESYCQLCSEEED